MSEMEQLLAQLTPAQQRAINLLQLALSCYNTRDGVGLFSGPSRYDVLTRRCQLAATQSRGLVEFWAVLCRRMAWPVPPRSVDAALRELLTASAEEEQATLRVLARETVSVVQIARMLNESARAQRRAQQDDLFGGEG